MISFAGGLPAPELFPVEQIRRCCQQRHGPEWRPGAAVRRDGRARRASRLDCGPVHDAVDGPDSQQRRYHERRATGTRFDRAGLLDPGDRVVAENPTYLALLSAWRPLGVEFLPIAADAEGADPDHLETLLERRPKAVYLIPNFQNPTGSTLSLPRRRTIVGLLRRAGVVVVEDDPYGELRYEGESLPSLFSLDSEASPNSGGNVVYVGTFSKVLAPGLRLGWAAGPEAVIDKIVQAKQATDLHTSTFNQHIAWELIRTGFLSQHLPRLRQEYRRRRDAMLSALEGSMPLGSSWTRPDGGMFLMV